MQHPGVQAMVWLFALPVAVWLWAVRSAGLPLALPFVARSDALIETM